MTNLCFLPSENNVIVKFIADNDTLDYKNVISYRKKRVF